jgi:hypothetical protein
MNEANENLPATITDDGFDNAGTDDRLIRGSILSCVDGVWSCKDGTDLPPKLIVLACTEAIQRWENQTPTETFVKRPGQPLLSVDDLNAKVPKKKWEPGIDGEPRPPWTHQYVAYLFDPRDASLFTYLNSTAGARIAIRELRDKVGMMRALRGAKVVPVVELKSKPMKTQFGTKLRPYFHILEWRDLSGEPRARIASPALDVGTAVKPASTQEILNDEVPFS